MLSDCQVLQNIRSEADCAKVILITRTGRRTGTTEKKKKEVISWLNDRLDGNKGKIRESGIYSIFDAIKLQ